MIQVNKDALSHGEREKRKGKREREKEGEEKDGGGDKLVKGS